METSLIPYIGGLLVSALFSNANAELGALFFTIAATITVKFLADTETAESIIMLQFIVINLEHFCVFPGFLYKKWVYTKNRLKFTRNLPTDLTGLANVIVKLKAE